jgi:hypothetical protein
VPNLCQTSRSDGLDGDDVGYGGGGERRAVDEIAEDARARQLDLLLDVGGLYEQRVSEVYDLGEVDVAKVAREIASGEGECCVVCQSAGRRYAEQMYTPCRGFDCGAVDAKGGGYDPDTATGSGTESKFLRYAVAITRSMGSGRRGERGACGVTATRWATIRIDRIDDLNSLVDS